MNSQRVQLLHPLRHRRIGERAHERLGEGTVEREIDLRNSGRGSKAAIVRRIVSAERADVVERPFLAAHDPVAARQIRVHRIGALALEGRLIEAGRQHVDQVDVVGELAVLLAGDPARNKDAEVADLLVHRIDDGLAVRADVVDAVVEVEDPAERLLRRGDVVALRNRTPRSASGCCEGRAACRPRFEFRRRQACCRRTADRR